MRIYPIGVCNNQSFGYNKQANDQLNAILQSDKKHKDIAQTYLEVNKLCMKTEDLIRAKDVKGDKSYTEPVKDLFVAMKSALAEAVNNLYPSLNYGVKEYESYKNDSENHLKKFPDDEDHWTVWMKDSFEIFLNEEDVDADVEQIGDYDDVSVNNPKSDDSSKAVQNKMINNGYQNKFLELYSPNRWSPVGLDSLGGMDELKAEVIDKIIFPIKNPELAKIDEIEYGKRYPRGILLYGPPGCGKTFTVEALAQELQIPLLKLKIAKVGSSYINQTSINYEKAFECAAELSKTNKTPVLLFIDEMDGLTQNRNDKSSPDDLKQVGTLLNLIETARDNGIIVIGATNKYDIVDEAVKARFDSQIYVGLPDEKSRAEILKVSLSTRTKGKELAQSPEKLKMIATVTKGFPNRALCILTDKAALIARNDNRREIRVEDYMNVIAENQHLIVKENIYKSSRGSAIIGFKNK